MNIALFDAAPFWSGGAAQVALCCKGYAASGHTVTVVCLPTSRFPVLLSNLARVYSLRPAFDLDVVALVRILRIIKRDHIDVLDIHSPRFYWLGMLAAKSLGRKLVITRNVTNRKKGIKKYTNRLLYHACDAVVTVSEQIREMFIKDFALPSEKVITIHAGQEITPISAPERERLGSEVRKQLGIGQEDTVIMIIGRIDRSKAHDVVIKSVAQLARMHREVKVLIVGMSEDHLFLSELHSLIRQESLEKNVVFTGFQSDVVPYLAASDILVSASYNEAINSSIVQGVLYKVPFVATDVCDYGEVIHDTVGVYVRPGSVEEMTQGILAVLNNRELFERNLEGLDPSPFRYQRMVQQYLELYEKIMNTR
jgi:glycosyltransferase involved in cell wall biosynthesis